ncbi:DUF4826 family protein [Thalassomonas sp. M1454]|uniref:DUF4826 family protein n=1 Tax=Thalassomonas sp. M1454 TaxID=2594477 RepID=UPI00118108EB|nr:DUF4826 family protein [Thalassomonas sp. M1454]TRX56918.1 DUF4826 family protein [Thalassomonas sp. M1454]
MTQENQPRDVKELTEEESQQLIRNLYLKATKYLADKGIVTNSVTAEDSRYLLPIVSVWKLNTLADGTLWVISGEVPCDHIPVKAAATAQEALRHFSMKWQLQAENIMQSSRGDETQVKFAQLLVKRAEGLHHLCNDEKLWK